MGTADRIIVLAQEYIQTGGYNSFSYSDIARDLDIKTASVHYHFSKKEELGVAVIENYLAGFESLREIDSQDKNDYRSRFDQYVQPFLGVSQSGIRVCLCGALSGELPSLPERMREAVIRFFDFHEMWLSKLLTEGKEGGAFHFSKPSDVVARQIFSSLQGALMIARAQNDPDYFSDVVETIKSDLFV